MKLNEFKNEIKKEYGEHFPNSLCTVEVHKFMSKLVSIHFYLASSKNECSYGYLGNDMFNVHICIDLPDGFNEELNDLPEKLTMKYFSNSYLIKPENQYSAYGSKTVSARKTYGKPEKLVKDIGKFIDRLDKSVRDDLIAGRVHKDHVKLLKSKLV